MANDIQLKRSSVPNKIPDAANVLIGEPVVNLTDQVLYTKNATGTVIVIGSGTTSNIAEGTNLYFTNARAYANTLTAIKTGNGIIYDNTTGNITLSTSGVTSGTYGGLDWFIPVVTVDTYGRVTSASNIVAPYSITNASDVSGGVNLRQRLVINNAGYLAAEANIKLAQGSGLSITRNNDNEIFITTAGDGMFSNVTASHSANVGNITLANQYLKINSLGSVSGATTINLTLGNMVSATATGAVQWTVTGLQGSSGYGSVFLLELTNGGVGTQTWMSGIRWPSGTPPSLQASGVDVLAFFTDDNGSNWRGVLNMSNSS